MPSSDNEGGASLVSEWLWWRRETSFDSARVATRVATPVDVCGRSNTIQHDDPGRSNTQQHGMDAYGRIKTKVARTSKPLVGILGDVDGRIVPVAPPPILL